MFHRIIEDQYVEASHELADLKVHRYSRCLPLTTNDALDMLALHRKWHGTVSSKDQAMNQNFVEIFSEWEHIEK